MREQEVNVVRELESSSECRARTREAKEVEELLKPV
jgi:hypothetical protein